MLIRFKEFLEAKTSKFLYKLSQTPSNGIKPGVDFPKHKKTIAKLLIANQSVKIYDTTVASINTAGNLKKMAKLKQRFLKENPNLEKTLLHYFKLSEAKKYCSDQELQEISNLFVNGICPLESTYGTFNIKGLSKKTLKDRKESGPFQFRQSFMRDLKNITLSEDQKENRQYNLYHLIAKEGRQKVLTTYGNRYFTIINGSESCELTKKNRAKELKKMRTLNPTNPEHIPVLASLQLQRIIDSCRKHFQTSPVSDQTKQGKLLRKCILLIGYKSGASIAKKSAAELIKSQNSLKNSTNPLIDLLTMLRKKNIISSNAVKYTLTTLAYQTALRSNKPALRSNKLTKLQEKAEQVQKNINTLKNNDSNLSKNSRQKLIDNLKNELILIQNKIKESKNNTQSKLTEISKIKTTTKQKTNKLKEKIKEEHAQEAKEKPTKKKITKEELFDYKKTPKKKPSIKKLFEEVKKPSQKENLSQLEKVVQKSLPFTKPRRMKVKVTPELNTCLKYKQKIGKTINITNSSFKQAYRDKELVIFNVNKINDQQYDQVVKNPKHWPRDIAEKYAKAIANSSKNIKAGKHLLIPRCHITRKYRKHISN